MATRRGPVPQREQSALRYIGTSSSGRVWVMTMTDETLKLASRLQERGLVGFVPHSTRSLKGSDAILTNAGRALLLAEGVRLPEGAPVFEDASVVKWP